MYALTPVLPLGVGATRPSKVHPLSTCDITHGCLLAHPVVDCANWLAGKLQRLGLSVIPANNNNNNNKNTSLKVTHYTTRCVCVCVISSNKPLRKLASADITSGRIQHTSGGHAHL